ncbi:MAG: rod shape-determining protein MreC [Synergistaceae bacterium]|nr:rod shape-determining protein MreC [Synergistaceae bacterium]
MADKSPGKEWIHGLLVTIASLLLLAAAPQRQIFRGASDLLGTILSVPEYPAVVLEKTARETAFWLQDRRGLQSRLETLEEENVRLKVAWSVGSALHLQQELDRLPGYARVTLREPFSWWSEVRINKGLRDGIRSGDPVLQHGFLAGRITSAEAGFAWVELITSSSLMVPVVIEETRDLGVVAGDGEGGLWLLYVPEGRSLTEGMTVSTAMVSEALPPGIKIGSLSPETRRDSNSYLAWRVLPGSTLSHLYALEVLGGTLKEKKPINPVSAPKGGAKLP